MRRRDIGVREFGRDGDPELVLKRYVVGIRMDTTRLYLMLEDIPATGRGRI